MLKTVGISMVYRPLSTRHGQHFSLRTTDLKYQARDCFSYLKSRKRLNLSQEKLSFWRFFVNQATVIRKLNGHGAQDSPYRGYKKNTNDRNE